MSQTHRDKNPDELRSASGTSGAKTRAHHRADNEAGGASGAGDAAANNTANESTASSSWTRRVLARCIQRPSPQERIAILFGFSAMAIILVWMMVMAGQRPLKYSDLAETAPWPDMRLNINTATEAELTVLPNIGPRLAERIVDDRDENGPFVSLDDLTRVRWIGPRTVEGISPYVFVGPDEGEARDALDVE